jgi:hypothetical protein
MVYTLVKRGKHCDLWLVADGLYDVRESNRRSIFKTTDKKAGLKMVCQHDARCEADNNMWLRRITQIASQGLMG